jgi:ABC-type branched-subunit amino acid transport system substrate-binding protein
MSKRGVVVVVVMALMAGCSSDRGADSSAVAEESSETGSASTGAGALGDFGELTEVCGPREGGGEMSSDDPAAIQGVSEDALVVGTVADPGFEGRPGLNQEIFDAGTAFVEWCNAAGGINGRRLELNLHDAAITTYEPAMTDACRSDFAIVGGGAVQDNLWETTGAACGLIDVAGFSATPEKAGEAGRDASESRSVQAVPNASDRFQTGPYIRVAEEHPDAVLRSGIVYGDIDTLILQADKTVEALEQVGYDFVHESSFNLLGEANWTPFAQALADDDVQLLHFVGEGENLALLLQAMEEIDYRPEVIVELPNFYDTGFLESAGPAAEGVLVPLVFNPFEEAADQPAVAQYLDMVDAVDGKAAMLGMQSMSAWLLFAQAAKACDLDNDLTRECVLGQAASTTEWTAGGLHAPTDPSSNEPTACFVTMRVDGGEFVRAEPDEGFDCGDDSDEPYVVQVGS